MGGKPSSDKDANDPSKLIEVLFSTFNTQIKKDVETLLTILDDIVKTDSLSLDSELRLGQMFTTISQRVTNVQKQLASHQSEFSGEDTSLLGSTYTSAERKLAKFGGFFMNIEWSLSDIKTSRRPYWEKSVSKIITKIRSFMQTDDAFPQILNQAQKPRRAETKKTFSFSPKFKPPELTKKQKIGELEEKIQAVDRQIHAFS